MGGDCPEKDAWDNAITYTNSVAKRWLMGRATDSEMNLAFNRESIVYKRWGGPRG